MREDVAGPWRIAARSNGNVKSPDFEYVETPVPTIGDSKFRKQVIALYFLVIGVTGLLLGPTTIGPLSELVFGEEHIRHAAALVPMLYGLPVLFTMPATRKRYRALMAARSQS